MGDQADEILSSFGLSEEEQKVYETVKGKFENHFIKRRNIIYERAKFNQGSQREGEPVDDFITALYTLSDHCNYGNFRQEMIRDRIVVGILNQKLSEQLQLLPDLTLEMAVTKVRQSELVKQQQAVVRQGDAQDLTVEAISKQRTTQQPFRPYGSQSPDSRQCPRCGRNANHDLARCPARTAICGHYQAVCRTPTEALNEIQFLGTGNVALAKQTTPISKNTVSPWYAKLLVNGHNVQFKLKNLITFSKDPLRLNFRYVASLLLI